VRSRGRGGSWRNDADNLRMNSFQRPNGHVHDMLQLGTNRFLVAGKVRGHGNELRRDEDARQRDARGRDEDGYRGSRRLAYAAACELALERGKHQAEDAGKRDGCKDVAPDVQKRKDAGGGDDPGGT